jgi:hypothetical protein
MRASRPTAQHPYFYATLQSVLKRCAAELREEGLYVCGVPWCIHRLSAESQPRAVIMQPAAQKSFSCSCWPKLKIINCRGNRRDAMRRMTFSFISWRPRGRFYAFGSISSDSSFILIKYLSKVA